MATEIILEPCCKCGNLPTIEKEVGDLYYARCPCGKWHPNEILGMTSKSCKERWNEYNRPLAGRKNYNDI